MSIRYKKIMLTGAVSRTRAAMETAIRNAGGSFENAATKAWQMDYIIVGYRAGGKKLDNGRNFITENDFWQIVESDTFRPRIMTSDQARMYAATLNDKGVTTERTRQFFAQLDGGVSPVSAAASVAAPKLVSGQYDDLADDMSDFFGDD